MRARFNPSDFSHLNNAGYYGWWIFGGDDDSTCTDHKGILATAGSKVSCSALAAKQKEIDAKTTQLRSAAAASTQKAASTAEAVSSAAPSGGWPTVRKGSSGDAVAALHKLLKALGYSISSAEARVEGFGNSTYEAVTKFQQAKGLGVDGIVGPQTWSALSGKTYTAPAAAPAAPTYDPASLATVDADQDEPFYKQSWFLPVAVGAGLLFFGVPIVLLATR